MTMLYGNNGAFGTPIDLPADLCGTIVRIIREGWAFALLKKDVKADAREVALNERLRDGMRSAVNSADLPLVVHPGMESRSQPELGVPDGRTDISISSINLFLNIRDHDPHAIIECKRITGSNRRLCRKYVVHGIKRFKRGQYSARHTVGFMVGYLLAGDPSDAIAGINKYLTDQKRSSEHLVPSTTLNGSCVWSSQHHRRHLSLIMLHHTLLGFESSE